jgi:ribosome biogenesis GTPase
MRGLIAEVDTGAEVYACTIRRVLRTRRIEERHPVATGDLVRFDPDPVDERNPNVVPFDYNIQVSPDDFDVDALPTGVVEWVAPRGACLTRKSGRRTHTVVANVDQAIIVSSVAEPYCKPHLIDRYLVSAHAGGITPLVCVNKMDLDEDGAITEVAERYVGLGYRVLRTSAVTRKGVDELAEALRKRSSVIVGQSGVGKSSLLNAVQPELGLRVARVSEQTEKGRHTTSTAQLHRLLVGGYVVDTPGVKSFELAEVPLNELEMHFIDVAAHVADCKYPNCTHIHEDHCAVKQAVDDGRIHPARYESYVKMFIGE